MGSKMSQLCTFGSYFSQKESRKQERCSILRTSYTATTGNVRRMAALAQMKDEKCEMRSFSAAFAMSTLYIYVLERLYKVGLQARWW